MKQGHLFKSNSGPMAHARRSDPGTSKLAAESISSENIRASQQEILKILATYGPLSDGSIYKYVKRQSTSGARTRRSELVRQGLVQDSQNRETTVSGRLSIIWELVDENYQERIYGSSAMRS